MSKGISLQDSKFFFIANLKYVVITDLSRSESNELCDACSKAFANVLFNAVKMSLMFFVITSGLIPMRSVRSINDVIFDEGSPVYSRLMICDRFDDDREIVSFVDEEVQDFVFVIIKGDLLISYEHICCFDVSFTVDSTENSFK